MVIGIIGGSGLYRLSDRKTEEGVSQTVSTPYGEPSGPYWVEQIGPNRIVFLPRHGAHHAISPSQINYRANVYGFKKLGISLLISVSAVGSLREEIAPGDFVLPDQLIDATKGIRENSFFGEGIVAHAPMADPFCETLRTHLSALRQKIRMKVHVGGTYVCVEGPQFSTKAESNLYRSWPHTSVIGMTALPEARLAREAGLCYQTIAMATDYDCWKADAASVSTEEILKVLNANVSHSREWIKTLLAGEVPECRSGCKHMMDTAIVTPKEHWPVSRSKELQVILNHAEKEGT